MKKIFILLLLVVAPEVFAQTPKEIAVDFNGVLQQIVYDAYIPEVREGERLPVLVCVGGLPIIDGKYVHSDPRECRDDSWHRFAEENRVAILGLGFLFVPEQWEQKTSYQYPRAWSGGALLDVLRRVADEFPVDPDRLYLFGISAGAQFSIRFAQMRPDIACAVAAHAAGGYDLPREYIPSRFLITVGELDNTEVSRREMAREFYAACREQGIDVDLEIIPGIGHRQTEGQNEMSRRFFSRVIREEKGVSAE